MSDAAHPHAAYLAVLPDDQRAALEALSARLIQRLPPVEPVISYAMPAFRLAGSRGAKRIVVGFAAFRRHLGLYPFSGGVIGPLAPRIAAEGFKHSKSGVLFTPERPLPDWLLDAVLAARRAEIG